MIYVKIKFWLGQCAAARGQGGASPSPALHLKKDNDKMNTNTSELSVKKMIQLIRDEKLILSNSFT